MMRLFNAPAAVLGLLAVAYLPSTLAKPYPVHIEEFRQLHNASQIEKRQCAGSLCGWQKQLCCPVGTVCFTDSNQQAQCGSPNTNNGGGGWQAVTTTYVETVGLVTKTSVYSTYLGGAAPTGTCLASEQQCGARCCSSGLFCNADLQCVVNNGGSSGGILPTLVPPVTYTGRPTATVPFQTPIPTGVNGTPEQVSGGGGGLSGGAIAGIVIGVILGILLLLLLCLFCCARALFDTLLAIFGIGKKNKHTHEETYIEEHRHSHGGAGRTWYGAARPARPSRVGSEKKHSGIGKGAGVAAALGGLALMLGLKRHQDKKHDDKSTTVSGSSYYYSDYTSSSSASSDRRTRNTRHSSRR